MPLLNVPLRLVGVIGKLYVVLESDRGLVLLGIERLGGGKIQLTVQRVG